MRFSTNTEAEICQTGINNSNVIMKQFEMSNTLNKTLLKGLHPHISKILKLNLSKILKIN